MFRTLCALWILSPVTAAAAAADPPAAPATTGEPLAGTAPLDWTGDIASRLVDGVDRFLLRELEQSIARRPQFWKRDFASPQAYEKSVEPNRQRLAHILGLRDPRIAFDAPELVGTTSQPALIGQGTGFQVFAVRWPAFGDVYGTGLLLEPAVNVMYGMVPERRRLIHDVVAIPDADQTPEMIAGLAEGVPVESQYARRLAESGCRVLVPLLINRGVTQRKLSNREFLYRSAFEMGRHLIGYELQKVLAGVDWFAKERGQQKKKIGVMGYGEGGMLALYAGALDPRIDAVCVSGYFGPREGVWQEPLYRNVFGLLEQFGDAELAALIAPRLLIVEAATGPQVVVPPGTGGGPGRLITPKLADVRSEVQRAGQLVKGVAAAPALIVSGDGTGPYGTPAALQALLDALVPAPGAKLATPGQTPRDLREKPDAGTPGMMSMGSSAPQRPREKSDLAPRHREQMHEIDRHSQWLLSESPYVRQEFMKKLDTSSVEKYTASVKSYREFFRHDVIGQIACERLPFHPRSRKAYDKERWTGYEVVLDVFPDVIAYGILLLPKDLRPGEKRPVVVCQHGLEGRPQDIVQGDHPAYHDFAAKLAERGFITFAPQNLYIFTDRFRTLQRKANPLKQTLFSVIVPQHQQIVDWLSTLPGVDPQRIGFYGLSYGGKSAMRIPALVEKYCLSICSADFNEWVWKNASTRAPYSYVWTGEYEIFEFDLGSTFNYAEMAALIAPRPFMVERGHFDGVSSDEAVAYEFAKVRHLYSARLHLGDRTEIEWFVGPHTINGKGTYAFLHKHLRWPEK